MLVSKSKYFHINGYQALNTPHPNGTPHKASVVLIKNNIKHHEINKLQCDFLQATRVNV